MDLFDATRKSMAPLSERMRCTRLEDFLGQEHLLSPGSLLTRAIKADRLGSCIFYGPPGTGKTTLANVIASTTNCGYASLNAVSSGVADAKKVIEDAKNLLALHGKKTYLLLDECHRWSKAQSDCVLPAIEKGEIVFIGSTTENPFVSMTRAILSRCRVFEFKPLSPENIRIGLLRAISDKEKGLGNYNLEVLPEALEHFVYISNGDMRTALNALELAVLTTDPDKNGKIVITAQIAEQSSQNRVLSVDETTYYDILSAFCKSLRGSDADAALYYAMRLINAGCDPLLIARRMIAHAAEDVGLADPNALPIAVSAMLAYERMGLPEGRLPLCEAIIYICQAEKSNSVVKALYAADEASKRAEDAGIPDYLRENSYKQSPDKSYKYPHEYGGWVEQQYLPDSLKNERFYFPSDNGAEKGAVIRKLRKD
jgi:putative ATPase